MDEQFIAERLEAIRHRLGGGDLTETELQSMQLHMEVLDKLAHLRVEAGEHVDHMDDHDHTSIFIRAASFPIDER